MILNYEQWPGRHQQGAEMNIVGQAEATWEKTFREHLAEKVTYFHLPPFFLAKKPNFFNWQKILTDTSPLLYSTGNSAQYYVTT